MLTPADIHDRDFKRGFRGYNEDEVDAFLDEVVADFEALLGENHQLKEAEALLTAHQERIQQLEKSIQDTLAIAQKTADEILQNAETRARELRQLAEQECENRRQQAQLEIDKKFAEAERRLEREAERLAKLRETNRQSLEKMREILRAELALLDEEERATERESARMAEQERSYAEKLANKAAQKDEPSSTAGESLTTETDLHADTQTAENEPTKESNESPNATNEDTSSHAAPMLPPWLQPQPSAITVTADGVIRDARVLAAKRRREQALASLDRDYTEN